MKDDSLFLINYVKTILNDKLIGKYMEKQKYEQAISECKKWRSLIKTVVGRNITVLSSKKINIFQSEYGEIVNAYEISIGIDEIYYVWN